MKATNKERLMNNLDKLVTSNQLLSEAHHKLALVIEKDREEKNQFASVCKEVYQDLLKKETRSIVEESWFRGLKNILRV